MTPAEYRDALTDLGLSHEAAWELIGVSRRTHFRYLEDGPPETTARLLKVVGAIGLDEARRLIEGQDHARLSSP